MLFSAYHSIERRVDDDWFDLILDHDTELFVDPFLLFRENSADGIWRGAHDDIIAHFNRAFLLIAEGGLNPNSLSYKKSLHLLTFPEAHELCLGYTSTGTRGAGGGQGYAKQIAAAIADAIRRGLHNPRHFEELGILNRGIGPDRISDATCTILKTRMIHYTQNVAKEHAIPTVRQLVRGAVFNTQRQRWDDAYVDLPKNPSNDRPILLVPQRFLRDLPVLNAEDWWKYYEAEQLREDINYEVIRSVDKATIIQKAREHPESLEQWARQKETAPIRAYDVSADPLGVWLWDPATAAWVRRHPLTIHPPSTQREFADVIETVIQQYRLFIEDQGGWELLWDDGHDKPEHAAQLVFRGIAQSYCRANNISLDAEVNLGRGPVDFKFSNGYERRAHLEVKKVHNGKFWNGIEQQLPSYMKSDEVDQGWFLAIRYRSGRAQDERVRELASRVAATAESRRIILKYEVIDARPKLSASKL